MVQIQLKMDEKKLIGLLDDSIRDFDEEVKSLLKGCSLIIEKNVKEQISQLGLVDTGRFMNSIHTIFYKDSFVVTDGVTYGIFLEYGTSDHGPVKANALHFFIKEVKITPKTKRLVKHEIFAKKVKGIRPYAPFAKGLAAAEPELRDFISSWFDSFIENKKT